MTATRKKKNNSPGGPALTVADVVATANRHLHQAVVLEHVVDTIMAEFLPPDGVPTRMIVVNGMRMPPDQELLLDVVDELHAMSGNRRREAEKLFASTVPALDGQAHRGGGSKDTPCDEIGMPYESPMRGHVERVPRSAKAGSEQDR